jgi:endonuclease-3 related protein
MPRNNLFIEMYECLYAHYGPQNWWPGETSFEVMVGAVLTQNTSWSNVVKATDALKEQGLLDFASLYSASQGEIAACIKSSGYFNVKARRLHNLLQMIVDCYDGDIGNLLHDAAWSARANLLSVKGVGPETADAILLYAGKHPLFVIDAYTHRVFSRHGLVPEECDYYEMQELFTAKLPEDAQLYNEYHALIVRVGKEFCKKTTPLCEQCPLKGVGER